MEKKTIGIAITGSFCTFDKMTGVIKTLTASGMRVIPIFSENVQHKQNRLGRKAVWMRWGLHLAPEIRLPSSQRALPIRPC